MQTAVKTIPIVVLTALRFIAFFLVRRFDSANPALSDQIPSLTDMDRNDRLHVQDVLLALKAFEQCRHITGAFRPLLLSGPSSSQPIELRQKPRKCCSIARNCLGKRFRRCTKEPNHAGTPHLPGGSLETVFLYAWGQSSALTCP